MWNISMTIRPQHILIALPFVLAGWLAVLAGVMALGGAAPAALVLLPAEGFRLPPGVAILSQGPVSVTVQGDAPDLVRALYQAGARLVLPAGLTGCLPQA
jgi:hypothetical protein